MNLRLSIAIVLMGVLVVACSDQKALENEVHPSDWVKTHGADDESTGAADNCKVCHGNDYAGGTVGVGCTDCHLDGPPFTLHPAAWTSAISDHGDFPLTMSWTECSSAICHGADLAGGSSGVTDTGPSCFSSDHSGLVCHSSGPPAPESHFLNDDHESGVLDYLDPADHGGDAEGRATAGVLTPGTGHVYCANCHSTSANDFGGGMVALIPTADKPSCSTAATVCHDTHSDALAHPALWTIIDNPPLRHDSTPAVAWAVGCALCHPGTGTTTSSQLAEAPSCMSNDFTNAVGALIGCHGPEGPQDVPHILGDNNEYLSGELHGPDAKADLTLCQKCHGESGGPGTNPRFNLGINSAGGNGCEACHDVGTAHSIPWAGPNAAETYHYSAKNIFAACVLCHGASLDGAGAVGGSCLNCHISTSTFTLDCTTCHGQPPTTGTNEDVVIAEGGQLVDHGAVPTGEHFGCLSCHGMTQGTTAGSFTADPNYPQFNPALNLLGSHWNGEINMSGPSPDTGAGYNETNFGCDNACHENSPPFQLSTSLLPIEFGDYAVQSAPHTVGVPPADPTSFTLGSNHGPVAKQDLTFCQQCHGQLGGAGDNPRFDLPMIAYPQGCESCHVDAYAHPTGWQGTTGAGTSHRNAANINGSCVLCHGAALSGGGGAIGPSCSSNDYQNSDGEISACHSGGYQSLSPLHPTGWNTSHVNAARLDVSTCLAECHQDIRNAPTAEIPGCANCHFGGATSTLNIVHPDGSPLSPAWTDPPKDHRDFADNKSDLQCAGLYCHGDTLDGGIAPPNGSWAVGGPRCEDCH